MASEYQQGDDTDVFIILIHHYSEQQLTNFMVMESLSMADLLLIYAALSRIKNNSTRSACIPCYVRM